MKNKSRWLFVCLLTGLSYNLQAADQAFAAALASPDRPAAEKERDAVRKPAQVIELLGIESGMTVMDVISSEGYFTEVLSGAVGPGGKVVAQNPEWLLQMWGGTRAQELKKKVERLKNVELLLRDFGPTQLPAEMLPRVNMVTTPIDLGPLTTRKELYEGKMDAAITAQNLHDMYIFGGEEGARIFLEEIYTVLKPGGVLGIIDHVGMVGQDNARLHRIEKPTALKLLQDAGFVIETDSDLLANPKDDHTLSMRDPALGRNTDQMFIKARKPAGN